MTAATVLVTGGAGFIGSHVVARLLAEGRAVVVLDDLSGGRIDNLGGCGGELDVVVGGLEALASVRRVDAVIHLAAQISVSRALAEPVVDLEANTAGTIKVLQWAARVGARRVVLASSAAVYGDPASVPVSEDMSAAPCSPYGASKRAAELYLGCLGPALGVETAALRLFNVYGPRQDPASPYSGVMSRFAAQARGGAPLVVFGDGAQTRDFVYVGDVAAALVRAVDADGVDGLVCNIGTGAAVSIAELAAAVIAAAGSASVVVHEAARVGDIVHSRADVRLAAARLGWRATVPLAEGLRATLDWLGQPGL